VDASELEDFIRAFEDRTFPIARWNHAAHLRMACWYLSHLPHEQAVSTIRNGIQEYNVAQGGENTPTSGYHETLTIFWSRVILQFLEKSPKMELPVTIDVLVAEYGDKRNFSTEFYSFDVVKDTEARARWIEPDLKRI
jgi:hypothetical protein